MDGRANETWVDFAAHVRSLGAQAEAVDGIAGLETALERAEAADHTCDIAIQTDPGPTTEAGGAWWDVAVPEVSPRARCRTRTRPTCGRVRRRRWAEAAVRIA